MKPVRLIKKQSLTQQPVTPRPSSQPNNQLQRTVKVVKEWVNEQRISQQQQARQVFASLFVHPQT